MVRTAAKELLSNVTGVDARNSIECCVLAPQHVGVFAEVVLATLS